MTRSRKYRGESSSTTFLLSVLSFSRYLVNVLDTWITTDVVVAADRTLSFHSDRAGRAEEVAVSRHILPRPVPVLPMNGARELLLFSPVKATASERALPRVARESQAFN